jgi:hypothetical protein
MKCVSYMIRNLHPVSISILGSDIYKFHHDWCICIYLINKSLDVLQTQAIHLRLHIVEPAKVYNQTMGEIKAASIRILQPCLNEIHWTTTHIYYCKIHQILSLRQTNKKLDCRAISQSVNNFPDDHTNRNKPSRPSNKLAQYGLIVAQLSEGGGINYAITKCKSNQN